MKKFGFRFVKGSLAARMGVLRDYKMLVEVRLNL